jgi:pimeloyl-ACP methyl ester carboxylesterase
MSAPETRYAKTRDGLSIAYQVTGSGTDDIVFLPYLLSVDSMWDDPSFARFLTRLSRVGRLICIDLRGCGASDPVPLGAIAFHIGQRVSALAGPGEVLVSRTVTDLVAGSGLEFEERGDHELKGVPGTWAIYAVSTS